MYQTSSAAAPESGVAFVCPAAWTVGPRSRTCSIRQPRRGSTANALISEIVNRVVHQNHRCSQDNRAIRHSATDNSGVGRS